MEKITGATYSREALIEALRAGERIKFLHFWGHRPLPDGRIGASCLSQWWPSPFTVDGVEYATAEHWMMAAKARLFGDAEGERRVLEAGHPAEAKKAGRLVRGFDEAIWRRERFGIVVEGSVHKFAAHAELREFLLGTGERSEMGVPPAEGWGRVLVEASPVDRVWGIGLAASDEGASDPERWRGPNLLGFALMEARRRLREGDGASSSSTAPSCTAAPYPTAAPSSTASPSATS
ncbi:NADAR family protein [Streptomyces sp. 15-116A]|uniref:NADAR family protein n=1 Tax=Streptomyces sp. 15-116A TaxID=2259035 RepID=UPI0021B43BBE|nr:NADAR family protein [Streptomyces sp. 15-116A]MCT7355418.1 NADAR family protein [Streptomyces sp. 15-116A]